MTNCKKITINKKSVDLVISIDINEFTTVNDAINALLKIAIENGSSSNVIKQVFDIDGKLKINNTHTFY